MKKIITLFAFVLTALCSSAQEHWNAVKVFDFDTEDNVYNMYIDSLRTTDGEAVFCFQSDSNLIKTDFNGAVIDETVNNYHFFAIFNGDTIISKEDAYHVIHVINVTTGDTIYKTNLWMWPGRISASSSGIYLCAILAYRNPSIRYFVINCLSGASYKTGLVCGLCCSGDGVYVLEDSTLTYFDENKEVNATHSVPAPSGIAEYRGSLYVYSNADKAVYRLELSNETAVYSVIDSKINSEPVHYGLDGKMIDSSTPGIHIVRYPDGTVNKTIVL